LGQPLLFVFIYNQNELIHHNFCEFVVVRFVELLVRRITTLIHFRVLVHVYPLDIIVNKV